VTDKMKASKSWPVFTFFVSPKSTVGVDTNLLVELGDAVQALIVENIAQQWIRLTTVRRIMLFPLVSDPTIFDAPEYVSYQRTEPSIRVSRRISFDAWMRARRPGRIRLAVENFEASLNALDDKKVPPEVKTQLKACIDRAANVLRNS
jgi:hypothetical protein